MPRHATSRSADAAVVDRPAIASVTSLFARRPPDLPALDAPPPVVCRVELAVAHPAALPAARAAVVDLLGGWSQLTERVVLVLTELAANALAHTPSGACVVRVVVGDDLVRVEVRDRSTRRLPRVTPSRRSGLRLVDDVATRWGQWPTGEGKTVWAEIAPVG